jgi:ABC-2 type transport system permease protein
MRLLAAYLRRDLADDLAYRLTLIIDMLDALVLLAGVFLLSRGLGPSRIGGYDPFAFLFVGLAVNAALNVCLVSFAMSVRGARADGMLRVSMIMPVPPWVQVLASSAYPVLRGVVDAALHLGAAALLGVSLSWASLPGVLLVFVLGLAAASSLGITAAAFAVVFRPGAPLLWVMGVAGLVLGGVFIPLDMLPPVLRAAAWITPVAPALAAMRPLLIDGAALPEVSGAVMALSVYAAVGIPLSLLCFSGAVRHARRRGTIKET